MLKNQRNLKISRGDCQEKHIVHMFPYSWFNRQLHPKVMGDILQVIKHIHTS